MTLPINAPPLLADDHSGPLQHIDSKQCVHGSCSEDRLDKTKVGPICEHPVFSTCKLDVDLVDDRLVIGAAQLSDRQIYSMVSDCKMLHHTHKVMSDNVGLQLRTSNRRQQAFLVWLQSGGYK